MISERMRGIEESGIRRMFEHAGGSCINLALGEPDFDVPRRVKSACISAVIDGENSYTPNAGIPELRHAIARKLKKENDIAANESEVIVTCGAIGGLSIAFQTLLQPGDEILLFDPYFVAYDRLARFNGAKPVFIDTYPDFEIDADCIEGKISPKTKAIVVNNPCNPTGRVYSRRELRAVRDVAAEHGLVAISDEVYEKFTYEKKHVSIASMYDNTVTVNSFSKSHAMAGWRIGYMHGPAEIVEQALKPQQFNFTCAPAPFQHAALAALRTSTRSQVAEYGKKRDLIWRSLRDAYDFKKPDGAFFAFIKSPMPAQSFAQKCLQKGLLVVPGGVFSRKDTHFRLSFSSSYENLENAARILNALADQHVSFK